MGYVFEKKTVRYWLLIPFIFPVAQDFEIMISAAKWSIYGFRLGAPLIFEVGCESHSQPDSIHSCAKFSLSVSTSTQGRVLNSWRLSNRFAQEPCTNDINKLFTFLDLLPLPQTLDLISCKSSAFSVSRIGYFFKARPCGHHLCMPPVTRPQQRQ